MSSADRNIEMGRQPRQKDLLDALHPAFGAKEAEQEKDSRRAWDVRKRAWKERKTVNMSQKRRSAIWRPFKGHQDERSINLT